MGDQLKIGGFKYSTQNIGDEIQSLAAEQFLPRIDKRFDRDKLRLVNEGNDKYFVIMNGWFSHTPNDCFPPSKNIVPFFISFHIAQENKNYFLRDKCISYFKKHEPIGCRDKGTMQMLQEKGVDAYFSGCLTTTFPKRNTQPTNGKVFLVDTPPLVDKFIKKQFDNIETIEHFTNNYGKYKSRIAQELLKKYKTEADLIITNRVHCALPCAAMGIPVIFFGDSKNYRQHIIKEIGIPFYNTEFHLFGYSLNSRISKLPFGNIFLSYILKRRYKNINFDFDSFPPSKIDFYKGTLSQKIKKHLTDYGFRPDARL
jgi:hypothetical protein